MRGLTLRLGAGLDHWAALGRGWPVELGPAWLAAEFGRITPQHFVTVVEDAAGPIAAAHWLRLTGREERGGYTVRDLVPDGADRPVLPCMSVVAPGGVQPAIVWDRDRGGEVRAAALAELVRALRSAAPGVDARAIVVTNVPASPDWADLRAALRSSGFHPTPQPPAVDLDIPADGLDGYLAGLPGRQRGKCRHEIRAFQAATPAIARYGPERLLADDIAELLQDRYRKYGHTTAPADVRDRLDRATRLPGLAVLVAETGGRAWAFHAFAVDPALRRIVPRFAGNVPNNVFAYFNLTFYEPIRYGASHGLTSLALGTGTYAAKVARGGHLAPRAAFVRVLDDAGNAELARQLGDP